MRLLAIALFLISFSVNAFGNSLVNFDHSYALPGEGMAFVGPSYKIDKRWLAQGFILNPEGNACLHFGYETTVDYKVEEFEMPSDTILLDLKGRFWGIHNDRYYISEIYCYDKIESDTL